MCLSVVDLESGLKSLRLVNLTEVWILQGIYPLKDEWVFGCSLKTRLADQTKNSTTEVVMVKRLNELNNQPEIGWTNTRDEL